MVETPLFHSVAGVLPPRDPCIEIGEEPNFGILPLTFADPADWERVDQDDVLVLPHVRTEIQRGNRVSIINSTKGDTIGATHGMTDRQVQMVLAGSLINLTRKRVAPSS